MPTSQFPLRWKSTLAFKNRDKFILQFKDDKGRTLYWDAMAFRPDPGVCLPCSKRCKVNVIMGETMIGDLAIRYPQRFTVEGKTFHNIR